MAIHTSSAAAIAACDAIVDLIDAHATLPGKLVIYNGTRPATANTAVSGQTALVTFTLDDPAFGNAAGITNGGQAAAESVTPVQASASGAATWFRVFDGGGNPIMDGTVSDTSGSGDCKISSTAIVAGIDVTIVSYTVTVPTGV